MPGNLYENGITQVKAYRLLQEQVADVVREHGLGSVSEWFVLSHVHTNGVVMAKDLAALLDVEAPLITRLVNNLVDSGLVSVQPHSSDRRAKIINPTQKSDALVNQVELALRKRLDKLLEGVSAADLATYQKVLTTIVANGESL